MRDTHLMTAISISHPTRRAERADALRLRRQRRHSASDNNGTNQQPLPSGATQRDRATRRPHSSTCTRHLHFGPALKGTATTTDMGEFVPIETPADTTQRRQGEAVDDALTVLNVYAILTDPTWFDLSDVEKQKWCSDCAIEMLNAVQARCEHLEKAGITYNTPLLLHAEHESLNIQRDVDAVKAELAVLEEVIRNDVAELKRVNKERATIGQLLTDAENEAELFKLDLSEMDFRIALILDDRTRAALEAESLEQSHRACARHLLRLRHDHPLRTAYRIELTDAMGTINGMEMRLTAANELTTGWRNVNAGLGQMARLFVQMAHRIGMQTENFTVLPLAEKSIVHSMRAHAPIFDKMPDELDRLPLFGSAFGPNNAHFDGALIGFMECMHQLATALARSVAGFQLPNPFERNGIVDGATDVFFVIR